MNEAIKILETHRDQIFEKWIQTQLSDEGLHEDLMSNEELRAHSGELLNLFIKSLNDRSIENAKSLDFEQVVDLLDGISASRARGGFSPCEIGNYIFSLKNALIDTLRREIKDAQVLFVQSSKISDLFDYFTIRTFETFIKGREGVILRQMDEITEISTPVIQVWDNILALPIIGTLDSSRTQIIMENLLQQIVDTGSSIAILDISGVPAVDSLVAQHLMKTVSATRLMGAECIISGIRPEIAQTVVHLGIDLSSIITRASLASALKTAYNLLQLQVVRKA